MRAKEQPGMFLRAEDVSGNAVALSNVLICFSKAPPALMRSVFHHSSLPPGSVSSGLPLHARFLPLALVFLPKLAASPGHSVLPLTSAAGFK